jgi:carboxymethylenebutenolidase
MTQHPTTATPLVRPPIILTPDITLQSPLSRRGHGPGLVLVVDHYAALEESATSVDPPPLQKWAEEGFAVAQIKVPGRVGEGGEFPLERTLAALKELEGFDGGNVGLVCMSSVFPSLCIICA